MHGLNALQLLGRDGVAQSCDGGAVSPEVRHLAVFLGIVHDPPGGGGPATVVLKQEVVCVAVAVLVRGRDDAEEALLAPRGAPAVAHDPAPVHKSSMHACIQSGW